MHPEIIQEGRAPVPPAEWVPMEPTESEDNKRFLTYGVNENSRCFTLPILSSRCQK
jgi:hypothetical protein